MKPILIVATVLILMLSACAPKATPTVDPAQVQASAVAAASTMVAMTKQQYRLILLFRQRIRPPIRRSPRRLFCLYPPLRLQLFNRRCPQFRL